MQVRQAQKPSGIILRLVDLRDVHRKTLRHLSSGAEYLIFDEEVASLTEAAIDEGFQACTGTGGRSAQAMTAAAFIGRLPTFPKATVDEVLESAQS